MTQPRVLILRAPGTNCDVETAFAFEQAGAATETLHVNRLLERPALLADFQIACLPGGFSYGDDVAAGRILGNQLRNHLADQLAQFKDAGKLILGICNGFQALIQAGVLFDGADAADQPATLAWNDSGHFEDRWVRLGVVRRDCVFLAEIESLELPVAHAEGKFVARDQAALADLQSRGYVALCYQSATGGPADYPDNPNGSQADVAGLADASGRVLGLMPHPERFIDATQHPQWTRRDASRPGEGLKLFENAVRYFR
jgi:phosphoribosylformylglycinamidine synthase